MLALPRCPAASCAPRLRRSCRALAFPAPSDAQLRDSNWLQTQLGRAVAAEDYAAAASLKAALQQLIGVSPPGDWFALGTPAWLADRAERLGFTLPTELQRRALPYAHAGRDVVLRSGTGSGKTLAFLLPLLSNLDFAQRALPQALVVVPSRELGVQTVLLAWRLMGGGPSPRGPGDGANMFSYKGPRGVRVRGLFTAADVERAALRGWLEGCSVVVGTPQALGRAIECGALPATRLEMIAVDEADASLPSDALRAAEEGGVALPPPPGLPRYLPTWEQRGVEEEDDEPEAVESEPWGGAEEEPTAAAPPPLQSHEALPLWRASRAAQAAGKPWVALLAGATLPEASLEAAEWAGLGGRNAVTCSLAGGMPPTLRHRILVVESEQGALAALCRLIRADAAATDSAPPRSIVFAPDELAAAAAAIALRNALWGVHTLAVLLPEAGVLQTTAQHAFRDGAASMLLATPDSERGLDWPRVRQVYSLAPAASPEAYLHRAGRAARLGDSGGSGTITTVALPGQLPALRRMLAELGVQGAEELAASVAEVDTVQALEDLLNLY